MGLLFFIFMTLSYGVAVSAEAGNSYIISAIAPDPNTAECSELWWPFKEKAEIFADRIGSPKTVLIGPNEQTILSSVPQGEMSFVFNIGHSAGPEKFISTCDMTRIPATALPTSKILFAFGCSTMDETGPGTFSSTAEATVGFSDLPSPLCYDCLQSQWFFLQWLLDGLANGLTIGEVFYGANVEFPECLDTGCARFAGDPTVKIYTPPAECGDRATIYSSHKTDWPPGSVWCKFGSSEDTPSFPKLGESVSWGCDQSENGTSAQCTATRDAKKSVLYYLPVILSAGKNK